MNAPDAVYNISILIFILTSLAFCVGFTAGYGAGKVKKLIEKDK